jgi:hypothetical protein
VLEAREPDTFHSITRVTALSQNTHTIEQVVATMKRRMRKKQRRRSTGDCTRRGL